MSLSVNQHRRDKGREGVNSSVKARFALLVRSRMSSQEIDLKLREKAQADSPGASLNNLIKDMVQEVAFRQARLSLAEFIQRFRKNGLADLIAARFANSLFKIDSEVQIEQMISNQQEEYQAVLDDQEQVQIDQETEEKLKGAKEYVRDSVTKFLEENKLTSTETLYAFLEQMKLDFPNVNISTLFLEEHEATDKNGKKHKTTLREQVAREINDSLNTIAAAAYKEIFQADKQGFVMGFIMGRVLKYDSVSKQMQFDQKEFSNLIGFLDGSEVAALAQVEGGVLYNWLYYDSREMAKYVEEQKVNALRFGVRQGIVQAGVMDNADLGEARPSEKPFFAEGFDVKAFHDRYIKPALFRYHSRKIRKKIKGRVREPDLFNNLHDTLNQGRKNYTLQLRHYVQALLKLKESNYPRFMLKVRELLGLQNSPLLKSMTDQQVEQQIAFFLEQVENKFHTVVGEALHFRIDNDVWAACVYPDDILKCRDLSQLMQWFISPSSFKEQYPKYKDLLDDQIGYMCAIWLKDFMGTMAKMSDKNFIEAEHRRDLIEKDMQESLNLKVLEDVEVPFRVMEELDENGDVLDKPVYRVAVEPDGVEGFLDGDDRLLNRIVLSHPNMGMISWDGKKYRVFPEEKKKFKKVSMNIPVMKFDEKQKMFIQGDPVYAEALIYSGDNHFVHVKEKLTRVISQDRGKEVTDENRWMLSFADPAGQEAFKAFLVARNPQGLIKLEDSEEGRFISNKTPGKNAAVSTKTFKEGQEFAHVLEMSYASELPPNENPEVKQPPFQLEKVTLETQCQKFRQLLITNLSNYTVSSHDVYRSQRAWPLLFDLYFSPEFFGDKYKDFQDEGFKTD